MYRKQVKWCRKQLEKFKERALDLTAKISLPVDPELSSISTIIEEGSLLDNTDSDSSDDESKDDLMVNSPKILF